LEFLIDQDHFVVATGGGLPCHNNLMELMNEMGETVFLDAAEETLLKRLELQTEQRPLLHSNQSLSEIITSQLAERISTYACAKHTLQVNEKPILSIVQELQFLLKHSR
jgi:shikimate kinase